MHDEKINKLRAWGFKIVSNDGVTAIGYELNLSHETVWGLHVSVDNMDDVDILDEDGDVVNTQSFEMIPELIQAYK